MKKNLLEISKVLILVAIVILGVGVVNAWNGPTVAPPGGNVAAPINVSSVEQIKTGKLGVGGLASFGQGLFSTSTAPYTLTGTRAKLLLGLNGPVGATEYCDQNGGGCKTIAQLASGSASTTTIIGGGSASDSGQVIDGGGQNTNLGSQWDMCAMTRYDQGNGSGSYCRVYKSGANWYIYAENEGNSSSTSCDAICIDVQ